MKRRRLLPHSPARLGLLGGSCLSLALTAGCGPMPGLVTEPPPHAEAEHAPASSATSRPAERRSNRAVDDETHDEGQDDVKIVRLKGADTYYLLDRRRGLCFMHHRDTMTGVDCHRIPEAKGFIDAAPEADDADDAAYPEDIDGDRARYRNDDGVVRRTAPQPGQPTAPPAPGSSVTVTPLPAPSAGRKAPAPKEAPAVTMPTPQELTHFEAAYFDVFCDRRAGGEIAPKTRIEAQGLSVERYTEIEGWWASDQDSWWQLTNKARRSCK